MSNGITGGYDYDPDDYQFENIEEWMADYELDPSKESQYETKDELLYDLYTQAADVVSATPGQEPISWDEFKELYGESDLFQTYGTSGFAGKERFLEKKFDVKSSQFEDAFNLKKRHEGEKIEEFEHWYGVDSEDDFESITEMKTRHSEDQQILNRRIERQKIINESNAYTKSRDKILGDALKSDLKRGNTEVLISEMSKDFWSQMKVVRNNYEKERLNKIQYIEDLIKDYQGDLADKNFTASQSIQTAFLNAGNNIQSEALDLIVDRDDLQDDFSDDTWATMGMLLGMDALLADEDSPEANCAGCADNGTGCRNASGYCDPSCC